MNITVDNVLGASKEVLDYLIKLNPELILGIGQAHNKIYIIDEVFKIYCSDGNIIRIVDIVRQISSPNLITGIKLAICKNQIEVVRYLCNYINVVTVYNELFEFSIEQGNLETMKIFIEKGANNAKSDDILVKAIKNKKLNIVDYLVQNYDYELNSYILEHACNLKCDDILKSLLKKYVSTDKSRQMLINLFPYLNRLSTFKILIETDKELIKENKLLCDIVKYDVVEMFEYMIDQGAEITDEIKEMAEDEIKDFIEEISKDRYFGVESDDPIDVDLPDLICIEEDRYYCAYPLKRIGTRSTDLNLASEKAYGKRYVLENLEIKASILRQLNLGEPGFFTL